MATQWFPLFGHADEGGRSEAQKEAFTKAAFSKCCVNKLGTILALGWQQPVRFIRTRIAECSAAPVEPEAFSAAKRQTAFDK